LLSVQLFQFTHVSYSTSSKSNHTLALSRYIGLVVTEKVHKYTPNVRLTPLHKRAVIQPQGAPSRSLTPSIRRVKVPYVGANACRFCIPPPVPEAKEAQDKSSQSPSVDRPQKCGEREFLRQHLGVTDCRRRPLNMQRTEYLLVRRFSPRFT